MPVNVFALEHPLGVCLFDTGQTAKAADQRYFPRWFPYFRLARFELSEADEAAAKLARVGFSSLPVRWIVLSHLHTDHVGGLGRLQAQEVLVSRVEWARAAGPLSRLRGYLPQYWPASIKPHLVDFNATTLGPFWGSYDLAGDGALQLVPTPGHTPGHMSLLAYVGSRRVLLGGDLCPTAEALSEAAPAIADFCRLERIIPLMTHDPDACALASEAGISANDS